MYYNMVFDVRVGNYQLGLIDEIEIHKSVDLISGTASVTLPGTAYGQTLDVESRIGIGDRVTIAIGYDEPVEEFTGYLKSVDTDDGNIVLQCEDEIYLTRKAVADKSFQKTSVKQIAEYLIRQLGWNVTLVCDYDITYDSFVIYKQTAYDVLKKLHDEIKPNIYMKDDELHIHPPYVEKTGEVKYDFAVNIEESDLKYKRKDQRNMEVEVEGKSGGKTVRVTAGESGGDKKTMTVHGITNEVQLKQIAGNTLRYHRYEGYEGSITTWLVPYVEPGFSAHIHDADYEYKDGIYYVVAVTTGFSASGGSRKVQLGIKLGGYG